MTTLNESQRAQRCAATIRKYWLGRGYAGIIVRIETQHSPKRDGIGEPLHVIQTNIGPRGYPPKVAAAY